MASQNCEACGRFGARRLQVGDLWGGLSVDGRPNRFMTLYLCRKCEIEDAQWRKERFEENSHPLQNTAAKGLAEGVSR